MAVFSAPHAAAGNQLLGGLTGKDYKQLLPKLEHVALPFGEVLYEAGEPVRHVHFPESGIISLIPSVEDQAGLEAGMVGNEGMVGISALLNVDRGSSRAVVRNAGTALRIQAALLRKELTQHSVLRRVLDRYAHALLMQLVQAVACNRFHTVEARFARWLLMTDDRLRSNEFHMTQELMAHMLGVRRAGVTNAASSFQSKKLISYHRGNVRILDRMGLEKASCKCYRIIRMQYDQMLD